VLRNISLVNAVRLPQVMRQVRHVLERLVANVTAELEVALLMHEIVVAPGVADLAEAAAALKALATRAARQLHHACVAVRGGERVKRA
jgi:hypothetical protein